MKWRTEGQKVYDLDPERRRVHELYLKGEGLDIGGSGYFGNDAPVVPGATIVDLNFSGYDGKTLPVPDASQDFVYSSHTLEHITASHVAIREWFRVIKPGGFLVITVPHQFLYEKRAALPSKFNGDHKRFYTASALATEVEEALTDNTYRIRQLRDVDTGFNYSLGPDLHSNGCYELEIVIEKLINPPLWEIK